MDMSTLLEAAQTAVNALSPGQRLMGLDLGTKTIGVATSDLTRQIATPRETIARKKFGLDAQRIVEIARAEGIGLIVLGLPINMDGSEGAKAQSTRSFARNFMHVSAIPTVFWDERLSTAAVTRAMLEADLSRAKRASAVDKLAAAYILQSFLDAACASPA
jgi:putative Holliday junction resolvase